MSLLRKISMVALGSMTLLSFAATTADADGGMSRRKKVKRYYYSAYAPVCIGVSGWGNGYNISVARTIAVTAMNARSESWALSMDRRYTYRGKNKMKCKSGGDGKICMVSNVACVLTDGAWAAR